MDLTPLANVAQIISFVWMLLGGSLTLIDVIKKIRQRIHQTSPSIQRVTLHVTYVVNFILATLLFLASSMILHFPPPIGSGTGSSTPVVATSSPSTPSSLEVLRNAPLVLQDPLHAQDMLGWDEYSNDVNGACLFKDGAYHAIANPGNSTSCLATKTDFRDLAFQTQVRILSGDNGGIIFRSNTKEDSFYAFSVTIDGFYMLVKSSPDRTTEQTYTVIVSGRSPEIQQGINQTNTLTVIARGTEFDLYINTHYVGRASDQSYASGLIGVFTNADNGTVIETAFTDLQVWRV